MGMNMKIFMRNSRKTLLSFVVATIVQLDQGRRMKKMVYIQNKKKVVQDQCLLDNYFFFFFKGPV